MYVFLFRLEYNNDYVKRSIQHNRRTKKIFQVNKMFTIFYCFILVFSQFRIDIENNYRKYHLDWPGIKKQLNRIKLIFISFRPRNGTPKQLFFTTPSTKERCFLNIQEIFLYILIVRVNILYNMNIYDMNILYSVYHGFYIRWLLISRCARMM